MMTSQKRAPIDEDERTLALERLVVAAKGRDNLGPYVLAALRAQASGQEIRQALRRVLGRAVPADVLQLTEVLTQAKEGQPL
jgi:methylmalonyl-CoA mutase N-terminal domain/subunit